MSISVIYLSLYLKLLVIKLKVVFLFFLIIKLKVFLSLGLTISTRKAVSQF